MTRSKHTESGGPRRSDPNHAYIGPVIGIAILLGCWLAIAEWHVLPELISSTMAALP